MKLFFSEEPQDYEICATSGHTFYQTKVIKTQKLDYFLISLKVSIRETVGFITQFHKT